MKKCNFKDSSDPKNKTVQNPFDDSDIQACSATDCTGLIPSLAGLSRYQGEIHPS